jgi:1-acyl-sn-glycerol-3-phosphate acyltransferase
MEPVSKARKLTLAQDIFVFGLARFISRLVMTLFGRATCQGANRFPRKGGVLIVANHGSDCDPLMVQMSCPRNVIFMAKASLFEMKFLAILMRAGNTFPVKPGEPDRAALRLAADYLKIGEVVCIFPEGQISEDGNLQVIKPGVALVIRMAQPQVICLGMQNTQGVMPYGKTTPHFSRRRVKSSWGDPRSFTKEDSPDQIVDWITTQLTTLTNSPDPRQVIKNESKS